MPAGIHYLALLRGINVGGKNIVRMADLRAAAEEIGLTEVTTYIQSGNLLFRAPRQGAQGLSARIESELSLRLGTALRLVLLTGPQLNGVIDGAPRGFGADSHRCDVVFLRKPLTANRALGLLEMREGVDSAWAGRGVLYIARLASMASGSRLSRMAMLPEYQDMTIRSWTTTRKLMALIDERRASGS